jgi:hypothetical protein
MATRLVNTATLTRGNVYSLRHPKKIGECIRFENGKPMVVEDEAVLNVLEGLMDLIEDRDGEVFEKPIFSVKRKVPAPEEETQTGAVVRRPTGIKRRPLRRAG